MKKLIILVTGIIVISLFASSVLGGCTSTHTSKLIVVTSTSLLSQIVERDGGDLELVGIEGSTVKLRLTGACGGCPHATVTIKQGIERILQSDVDSSIIVERVE